MCFLKKSAFWFKISLESIPLYEGFCRNQNISKLSEEKFKFSVGKYLYSVYKVLGGDFRGINLLDVEVKGVKEDGYPGFWLRGQSGWVSPLGL